jgi:5'(3')-deoxyribonucleotidase
MFKEIYIDLDGVLADFFSEWKNITGKNWWELDNNQLAIQKIRDEKNFWINLPLLRNSIKLLNILKENNHPYHILSSPLQNDQKCISQKKQWVKKMLKFYPPQQVIISSKKEKYATDNLGIPNILIDDFGINIKKWEKKGGIGIKHKDYKFMRTKEKLFKLMDYKYQNIPTPPIEALQINKS